MNIVTIMNYPDEENYNNMCSIFIKLLYKYNPTCNLFIIHKKSLPAIVDETIVRYSNIKKLQLEHDNRCWYNHHNVNYKLYNLCRVDQPFIFLDADIFCLSSLDHLWNLRNEKPFIAINHQNIPPHTSNNFKFINSGVQVVGDPDWYQYNNFRNAYNNCNGRLLCKGFDQAHIFTYCKQIGYDYTHPEVGYEWNSCAGNGIFNITDDTYNCVFHRSDGDPEPDGYNVLLNHYWWDYKPWDIDCPLYKYLK